MVNKNAFPHINLSISNSLNMSLLSVFIIAGNGFVLRRFLAVAKTVVKASVMAS